MDARQPGLQARPTVRVPVQAFGAKFQTKKEVYDFLTVDCKSYQPPLDTVTIWHLRDQSMGKKRRIKGDDVKHLVAPMYDSLSINQILIWAKANCPEVIEQYLPFEKELLRFPRQVRTLHFAANNPGVQIPVSSQLPNSNLLSVIPDTHFEFST
jgi:hypothetical protein